LYKKVLIKILKEIMNSKTVEIITIGDEILIGQIVDTNSAWMAQELNKAGFEVFQITSVHDEASHITHALDEALRRTDIVLITGGIGPTNDDITKKTLCQYFHTKLVFDPSVLENIKQVFANRLDFVFNDLTYSQAMVPENCTVIQNRVGTAPITWFEQEGKVVVSMPGVPYEMQEAMRNEIIPRLQTKFQTQKILHKTVQVFGYSESALAIKIADWEKELPDFIHLAYLPNYGIVKLRLTGTSDNLLSLEFAINQQIESLKQILGKAIIAFEDLPMEQIVGNLLAAQGKTIATAESCTGGNIAHRFTSHAGSSEYFKGGVVAYANEVKTDILQVTPEDLEKFGAVSQQVVEQMAKGALQLLRTDTAIATSGIAGPSGGTPDKPVGTVWIAVCIKEKMISRLFHFGNTREQIIQRTTQAALVMLKEIL